MLNIFTKKYKSVLLLVVLIIALNLLLKWLRIESTPPGTTYDEIIYASEAQVILKYGTDLSGNWRPWHLAPSDGMYSELTSTTLIPGFIVFPNNPILASKLVPVILGSLIPALLGLIVYYFYREKIFLLSTGLIATLNPWIFQFSRMGYDSLFSIVFYLIGIVCLLYFSSWKKLWAILPFFWGFFQYQGHKLVLVPLVLITTISIIVKTHKQNKYKQTFKLNLPLLTIVIFSLVLTLGYLLRLSSISSSVRMNEFSITDQSIISREVDEKRRLSLNSPFLTILNNKYTATANVIFYRLLKSFDPYILFIRGDKSVDTFTVFDYGFFHKIDIFLLILFLILTSITLKKQLIGFLFLATFTLAGTLPNLLRNGDIWITFRGAFAFIGLVMMISVGFGLLLKTLSIKWQTIILAIYLICSFIFLHTYFFRYPITHTLYPGFYERVLANYIKRLDQHQFLLITERTDATYDYLLTYNQLINQETPKSLKEASLSRQRNLANNSIIIIENCPSNWNELINENTIIAIDLVNQPCTPPIDDTSFIEIKSLIDSGTRFLIYNDKLCSKYDLNPYPHVKENKFAVEKLTNNEFCRSFFYK